MQIDYDKVGPFLNARRREKEISMEALATALGVTQRTLRLLLFGRVQPKPYLLEKLLQALGVPEEELPKVDTGAPKPRGQQVFISYSHRDKPYLERLLVHLKPLVRQGLIDTWADTRITAGDHWKSEIDKALGSARVAVLMVSADFLASDFIIENELPPLLRAAKDKGTLIVPVILSACRFLREKTLSTFQAINSPDEPLSLQEESQREVVYDMVAQRIEKALE
jgi:transcriptional regulator with XRE-family HTH domain